MSSRKRLAVRVGLAVLSVGLGFVAQPRAGASRAPARFGVQAEIIARERASSVTAINASMIEQLPSSRKISEILTQLPADRKITPGHLPDGWTAEQKGKQVRAWGPGVSEAHLRFDLDASYGTDYIGKPATIQGRFDGRFDDPIKITIGTLPKVSATPDLEGILTLPPQGVPGMPLLIGVAPGYRDGTWDLKTPQGSQSLIPIEMLRDIEVNKTGIPSALYGFRDTGGLVDLLKRPEPRPFITAFPRMDRFIGARYTDRWGEVTVDAPISILPVKGQAVGTRWIGGGSALTFAGQAACVSGRFPTFDDAYGLRLDGRLDLQPWGASQTSVMLGIPDDTTAGPHTISTPDGSSSITVGILKVEGSLDQNKLWRGESTTMRLRVVGTDRPFPMAVLNRSPEVITLDGGVRQVITTPGGADNAISRSVTGIRKGNFSIVYSVNSPGCGTASGG